MGIPTRHGDKAFCELCDGNENNVFSCLGGTTGSLGRHLINVHGLKATKQSKLTNHETVETEEFDSVNEKIEEEFTLSNSEMPFSSIKLKGRRRKLSKYFASSLAEECSKERTEIIHQALAKLIAVNQLPISFCSSSGFCQFMKIVEPGSKPCSENSVKNGFTP
ncbi:hypothetical protein ABEB36_009340 [Hypothenemus hampei]|uniref:Uncharacterized protein n=1 Tax=Hypothenemus hampei TaxID=57062 RepID=A0ABD1EG38_HYPHA